MDDLLNTVNAIARNRIDCVQQRKDNFKRAEPSIIRRVLNNGNHAEGMVFSLNDCPSFHHEILVFRVNAVCLLSAFTDSVGYSHQRLVANAATVHHESGARVKSVQFKRNFVFFSGSVRQDHAKTCSANQLPFDNFPVEARLVFEKHHFV